MTIRSLQEGYDGVPVAVTGASGFVGRHLVVRLLAAGAQISVLVRDVARLDPALVARCRVVQGDLTDTVAMGKVLSGAAYVFHCAADVATWGKKHDYHHANVQGVRVLLRALLQGSPHVLQRLVHLSTLDVYGFPALPASEDATLVRVPFHYGESKRRGDLLVQAFCRRHGISYTVLRPGNIIGPGSPFVSRIGAALRYGPMLAIDGGRHHAGLLDVQNLLDVLLWAAVSPQAHGQVYNVRDPWEVHWEGFLRDFRQGSGLKGSVLDLDYRTAMRLASVLAAPYRWLSVRREPLLHPLIVEIFGRTCGHAIAKLQDHGAPLGCMDYHRSMRESLNWIATQPGFKTKPV